MIEFLQPLVDAVAKVLPSIAKKKERDASAALGAELFLVYVQFNEALVLAEEIVRGLETYVRRMNEHVRTGGDSYALTAGDWISEKAHQQLQNLTGISNRIDDWKWELQVLDGQSTNNLRFLIDRKVSALRALSETIESQSMPIRANGILIDDHGTLHTAGSQRDNFAKYLELRDELREGSVPMNKPWGPEVLHTVTEYLASRKPRKQLDEIRTSLENIREALEANFTVQEILLRAGDPRAYRRRYK